jgi:SP family sugar:H+ symporter-like MFS transporter
LPRHDHIERSILMSSTTVAASGRRSTAKPPDRILRRAAFLAAAAALGGFLFGYDSAVINGAVTGIQDRFRVGTTETGTVVAVALLGSALGAAFAGRLADRLGRIRVMQIAAALFAVSAVGSALSGDVWTLGSWRVLSGVAIGLASLIGPTYIAEVAPARYRGRLASFQQMAIVLGIAASQLVNWGIARGAGGASQNDLGALQAWRWMLLAAVVPAVAYFVFASVIPESPRHLVAAGRVEQARAVLRDIEGPDVDLDARVAQIRDSLTSGRAARLRDLLNRRTALLPIVWVGIGVAVFQQLVGINVIFYYSSVLWQSVGITQSNSLLISVSTSIVNIVGTVVAMLLIDRIGRKPLALIGSAGMAASLGLAAWAFSFKTGSGADISIPSAQGTTALIAAHAFVFFFAVSWGVVLWVMVGEMFPLRIRAAAISVATAFNWIANWAVTETFPRMASWNLSATYALYAAFAVLSFGFIAKAVRETNGKRLEEMG